MAILTQIEKGAFLKLFNRGGYVLNFSTDDFNVFTMESVGVALCQKYGLSKGKSLTAFIGEANEADTIKLLSDLLSYYELHYTKEYTPSEKNEEYGYSWYNEEYARLYAKCKTYLSRINPLENPLAPNAEALKDKFSSEYLSKQIELMLKMQSENPTSAIGQAKELIESCCKTILDGRLKYATPMVADTEKVQHFPVLRNDTQN